MTDSQTTADVTSIEPGPAAVLDRFLRLFNEMGSGHTGDLASVYGDQVTFTDPFVSVQGLPALTEYFTGAYENVIDCRFRFADSIIGPDGHVCIPWVMVLRHKRIRRGDTIEVDGISHLRIDNDRIVSHRDYFDAGQLLYENLPVLGTAVRWLRKHAA